MDQPLYGADFYQSVKRFFGKYASFSGRASRSEYWWVYLFNSIVGLVLIALFIVLGVGGMDPVTQEMGAGATLPVLLLVLYWLATILPGIALAVRRLHDGNFSGLLYLISVIPFFGGPVLFILLLMPSAPAGTRFDQDGGAAASGNVFGAPAGYPGAPAGYPGAPAGGFAGQNPPQAYQQPTDPTRG